MLSYLRNLSIRMQLTMLFLVVLGSTLAFEAIQIRREYRNLYEHEVQANLEIARAVRGLFLGYINTVLRAQTGIIIAVAEKEHTPEEISRILMEYQRQTNLALNFGWLSPECRVIASSNPGAIGMDLSDRPYLLQVAQGADWSISDLLIGRVAQVPVFQVCKAIRDDAGNLKGILVASIDEERLVRELSFERAKSAGIALIDRNGRLVFRYPQIEVGWEDRNWLKFYPFLREVLAGKEYVGTYTANYDGKSRIIANLPMPFGWIASAGRSEDEVVGVVLSRLQPNIVIFGSILIATIIAILGLSNQIARSVSSLQEKSDAIGRGDFIAKGQIAGTKEFQSLSRALDAMSENVRAREQFLRQQARLLDLSSEAILVWEFGGCIEYWNAGATALYGYSREEAIGRVSHELLATVHPAGTVAFLTELEHNGQRHGEVTHRTKDGRIVSVETRQQLFRQDDRLLVLETNRDITERKRAEEKLHRLNENLEHAVQERTEKLRRLASELTLVEHRERKKLSTILHDGLQQYLVAAKMRIGGIPSIVGGEGLKQWVSDVENLLGDAVQVSRSLAAELSPPILRDAGILAGLEWLSRWMSEKHGLKVQLVMEMDAPVLSEDVKILLFESVREMLLNVVKHAGDKSAQVHLFQAPNHQLGLTVSDTGKGFEAKDGYEACSQGFGLFSIQERISLMGGTFNIDSAPGKGCRITLTAPLGQPEPLSSGQTASVEPLPQRSPPSSISDRKIRILIVDDHVVMREGLAGLLSQEPDFEVVGQAADGQKAIEAVASLQPVLVLMDISMPVMNGIDATRVIHQKFPHVAIIGLSLYTADERAREMLDAGAAFYMSKSGPPTDLKAAIRSCWTETMGSEADRRKDRSAKLN